MHGLCFLLERVEITEDCLAGSSPSATITPATPPTQEGVILASPGGEKNGDKTTVSPVLPSTMLEEAGRGGAEGVDGGAGGDEESLPEVEGDDVSVGRGSTKGSVAASGKGGQRDPQVGWSSSVARLRLARVDAAWIRGVPPSHSVMLRSSCFGLPYVYCCRRTVVSYSRSTAVGLLWSPRIGLLLSTCCGLLQ